MQSVAIVTGAGRGIGFAVAERLVAGGAQLAIFELNKELGADAAAKLSEGGRQVKFYHCNVADSASVSQACLALERELGPASVLVNNAGLIRDNLLEKISESDWDMVIDTNLKSAFLMCKAVLPMMRKTGGGKVVNISSRAWLGSIGQANYSASKGGIVSLTRSLALEFARDQINVNAVAPGLIDTPMVRSLPEHVRQRLINAQPTKKMGRPEDVAAAVSFLCSADAQFITGQVIYVCGGKSVGLAVV